ncbi:hypothetical protein J5N58_18445, partial [Rhizobium cremeum]|uniref:hypothetical protein n=1 Tax=Rhizobium cremeum TaxID=2813827 RepID=UPI001FD5A258
TSWGLRQSRGGSIIRIPATGLSIFLKLVVVLSQFRKSGGDRDEIKRCSFEIRRVSIRQVELLACRPYSFKATSTAETLEMIPVPQP